jgi:hypothetical protein
LVAAETNEGFIVFEIRERCAVDISDRIEGDLDSTGGKTLLNVTKNESFAVWIENVHCSRAEVNELLA